MFYLSLVMLLFANLCLKTASGFQRANGIRLVSSLNRIKRFSTVPSGDNIVPSIDGLEAKAAGSVKKETDLSLLEIRVGKIVEIGKHPEADSLYVEKVDLGEPAGPRTIVSGLVKFCSVESMQDRLVVVLCNLKPRPLVGITSHGMLLCASNADHTEVEPLTPSAGTVIGELITFEGHASKPVEPGNKATKVFGKIADDFYVNDDMIATFQGTPFMTSQGTIKASLKGKIS